MNTKYAYTVPVPAVDADFSLKMEKVNRVVKGTVYTKYAYTVPVPAVNADFSLKMNKLIVL